MGKEDHLSFRRCITNPLMLCMSDKLNAMKMYPLSQRNAMIALLLGMFIAFAGCSKDPVVSPAEEQDDTDFKSSIVLTDEEIASLMFMVSMWGFIAVSWQSRKTRLTNVLSCSFFLKRACFSAFEIGIGAPPRRSAQPARFGYVTFYTGYCQGAFSGRQSS